MDLLLSSSSAKTTADLMTLRRRGTALTAVITIVGLSACDGGGDPVEQALRETAAANHAATVRDGAVSTPVAPAPSADAALRDGLLASHRRDLTLAEATARDAVDPELRRLAEAAVKARRDEIAALEATRQAE